MRLEEEAEYWLLLPRRDVNLGVVNGAGNPSVSLRDERTGVHQEERFHVFQNLGLLSKCRPVAKFSSQ